MGGLNTKDMIYLDFFLSLMADQDLSFEFEEHLFAKCIEHYALNMTDVRNYQGVYYLSELDYISFLQIIIFFKLLVAA